MKTWKKLLAMTLSAAMVVSAGFTVLAAPEDELSADDGTVETVENFAMVVKNGVSFKPQGESATSSIASGSGLIMGGRAEVRDRAVVKGENKLYYKNGVTFTVVDPDKWAVKPSVYSYPTDGEYVIEEPERPVFSEDTMTEAEDLVVGGESVTVSEDTYYQNVDISDNGSLIFDVPAEQTLFVKIDHLNMNSRGYNRGSIMITGGGTVFMDVDNITGEKNKYINYPSNGGIDWKTYELKTENRLVMFVGNSSGDEITGLLVEGDMYFKNSVQLDKSFKICGNVVADGDLVYTGVNRQPTEEFNVLGQVYVPNGLFHATGAARIRGQLIADRAELYGNTTIDYHDFSYITVTPNYPVDVPDKKPDIEVGDDVTPVYPENPDPTPDPDISETPSPDATPEPGDNETPPDNTGYHNGVKAVYYDLVDLENSSAERIIRIEDQIKNNWLTDTTPSTGTEYPDAIGLETFSARYSGFIQAPESGNYTFSAYSDDGVRMTLNDAVIMDRWSLLSLEYTESEPVYLEAGVKYPYTFDYFQGPINATIFLFWQKEGGQLEQIPASAYLVEETTYDKYSVPEYINIPLASGEGLNVSYYQGETGYETSEAMESGVTNGPVDFQWEGSPDKSRFGGDAFSAVFEGYIEAKYTEELTLTALVDDGIRLYVDDALVIDQMGPNSNAYYTAKIPATGGNFHKIRIEYNNLMGPAALTLFWTHENGETEVVPAKYLYTEIPSL